MRLEHSQRPAAGGRRDRRRAASSSAIALLVLALGACGGHSGAGLGSSAAPASAGTPIPSTDGTRVLVYGDSLWDFGSMPDRCDLCPLFPPDLRITNFAAAGAEIWPLAGCDGLDDEGQPAPTDDPRCRNGVDRALPLPLHDDPDLDRCAARVAGLPTCMQDNPDNDVLLLQFGTNDVRTARLNDDARWQDLATTYAESLELILEERPAEMACVLVVPPPIWSAGYPVYNVRLDQVAEIVYEAADRHGCEVADLLGLYMQIEADQGPGATLPLYHDCASQGSVEGDCVHWAIPRPQPPVDEILEAIDRAVGASAPAPD